MNLLLDTLVVIWWDEGKRLLSGAQVAIREAEEVFVSSASAWEIAIKAGLGRLRPTRRLRDAVAESGFTELPVSFAHAERIGQLPNHHRDPFDRLLIAQALEEGLTVVTRDPAFVGYGVPVIPA